MWCSSCEREVLSIVPEEVPVRCPVCRRSVESERRTASSGWTGPALSRELEEDLRAIERLIERLGLPDDVPSAPEASATCEASFDQAPAGTHRTYSPAEPSWPRAWHAGRADRIRRAMRRARRRRWLAGLTSACISLGLLLTGCGLGLVAWVQFGGGDHWWVLVLPAMLSGQTALLLAVLLKLQLAADARPAPAAAAPPAAPPATHSSRTQKRQRRLTP